MKDIGLADLTWELEEEQHQLLSDYEDKCAEEVPNLTEQVETLEREARVQKKFSYHQDSMKRYKKQLSRNTDVVERKISEELAEGQTC